MKMSKLWHGFKISPILADLCHMCAHIGAGMCVFLPWEPLRPHGGDDFFYGLYCLDGCWSKIAKKCSLRSFGIIFQIASERVYQLREIVATVQCQLTLQFQHCSGAERGSSNWSVSMYTMMQRLGIVCLVSLFWNSNNAGGREYIYSNSLKFLEKTLIIHQKYLQNTISRHFLKLLQKKNYN